MTLNRHPSISLCDETNFFYYVYEKRRAFGDLSSGQSRRRLIDRYVETEVIKRLDLPMQALVDTLMREATSYPAFFAALIRFNATCQGKSRFGEKTPVNTLYSELLCEWFPGCKLIHIVRDPRDVVASLQRMPWARTNVVANAQRWRNYTLAARRIAHLKNYIEVRYESLVEQPEPELHRIMDFVGEEFSLDMLSSDGTADDKRWWIHRAEGAIHGKHVEKWRNELTQDDISLVEWICRDLIRELGYEVDGNNVSLAKRATALLAERFDAFRNQVTKPSRLWYHWVQPTKLAALEKSWKRQSESEHA